MHPMHKHINLNKDIAWNLGLDSISNSIANCESELVNLMLSLRRSYSYATCN